MAQPRHLRNAPITEALVDFRIRAGKNFRAEQLGSLARELATRFPAVTEQRGMTATFGAVFQGSTAPPGTRAEAQDLGLQGYVLKSSDGRAVVQLRADGFTFNRLKPYTSWQEILPTVLDLWSRYADVAAPECVTRIALRYINHIRLPQALTDFATYLEAPPIIPTGLPRAISSFLTKVVLHDPESGMAANVIQALQTDLDAKTPIVILDVDAYKVGELESHDRHIGAVLDSLHQFKNRIFFSSITENTVRLFA